MYSPWGLKESDTTEWLSLSLYNNKISIKKYMTRMPSRLCLLNNPCQQICVVIMGSACMHVISLQPCLTLCNPLDYNLPGSSVHGILQARILEWGAIPFSKGSSQPRNRTRVSCIVGTFFTIWAIREAPWWEVSIIIVRGTGLECPQKYALHGRQQPNSLSRRPVRFPRIQASLTSFTCDSGESDPHKLM